MPITDISRIDRLKLAEASVPRSDQHEGCYDMPAGDDADDDFEMDIEPIGEIGDVLDDIQMAEEMRIELDSLPPSLSATVLV